MVANLKLTIILPYFQKVNVCVCNTLATSVLINSKCPGPFFGTGAKRQGTAAFVLMNSQPVNSATHKVFVGNCLWDMLTPKQGLRDI